MLQPHAAEAEVALSLGEQILVRRVVQENAVIVDEAELHLAHHVVGAGELADVRFDAAVCNRFPVDGFRVDRLFRRSGLMRPKWDSRRRDSTYGADTIAKAISGCTNTYEPAIEIDIDDPACVDVSFPTFWRDLAGAVA